MSETLDKLALDGQSLPCPFHHDHPVVSLTDDQTKMFLADPYVMGLIVVLTRPDGARIIGDALARRILDGSSKSGRSLLDRARAKVLEESSKVVADQIASTLLPEVKVLVEEGLEDQVKLAVDSSVRALIVGDNGKLQRIITQAAREAARGVAKYQVERHLDAIVADATSKALGVFQHTMSESLMKACQSADVSPPSFPACDCVDGFSPERRGVGIGCQRCNAYICYTDKRYPALDAFMAEQEQNDA